MVWFCCCCCCRCCYLKNKCQANERNYYPFCAHSGKLKQYKNDSLFLFLRAMFVEILSVSQLAVSLFIRVFHTSSLFRTHVYNVYDIVVASWYLSLSTPKRNENTLLCLRFNYAHKLSLRNYNDQNAYNWSYFLLKCSNIACTERAYIQTKKTMRCALDNLVSQSTFYWE